MVKGLSGKQDAGTPTPRCLCPLPGLKVAPLLDPSRMARMIIPVEQMPVSAYKRNADRIREKAG